MNEREQRMSPPHQRESGPMPDAGKQQARGVDYRRSQAEDIARRLGIPMREAFRLVDDDVDGKA